jgi:hypothetical protein
MANNKSTLKITRWLYLKITTSEKNHNWNYTMISAKVRILMDEVTLRTIKSMEAT